MKTEHVCEVTNIRETDPKIAKTKCADCGFCARRELRKAFVKES